MSSKIAALTHQVDNYSSLLQRNLRLPIEQDIDGFIFLKGYMNDWGYSYQPPFETLLSISSCICYFHYFYKDSRLRIQYFDTIRAMGLSEMWLMEEDILDYYNDNDITISDFLDSVKSSLHCAPSEFSDYKFELYDNGHGYKFPANYASLYHDNFRDCFEKVSSIESHFDVKVLGLNEYENNNIRVIKDEKIMLLDLEKGDLRPTEEIGT